MVAPEICGSNQRKNGTRKREVCSAESASVEPTKIKPSQIKTGNQYLRKDRIQRSEVRDQTTVSFALANPPSTMTYPLTFAPIFMERMWGGLRLESESGKKLPPNTRIGESWEIADRPEAQSVVANPPLKGRTLHDLWTQNRHDIFGVVPETPRFPLLIKLLDAQERLSLQVHPPEKIAARLGGEPKTEFWYVAAADPGAELFLGFRELITRQQFKR